MSTPVRLNDPGEIAAAVPLLLGFHPHNSAVLIPFGEHDRLGPIVRADLLEAGAFEQLAGQMIDAVPVEYRDSVVVLIVAEQPRSDALADLARTATVAGMTVVASIYTTATEPGAVWTCCCGCGAHGRQPEPDPELAARAAVSGRATLASREALAATLSPVDPAILQRRAELLAERQGSRPAVDVETALDSALGSGVSRTRELADDEVLALIGALGDEGRTREVLLARTDDLADVLAALVRATPSPFVARPAVFLALAELLRGNGALAYTAVEVALAADQDAVLTRVSHQMVCSCPSPARVRELLDQP